MTSHAGSRASGYPPDFVPFRLRMGAAATARPALGLRPLALRLSGGEPCGKVPKSGAYP
jgi:hypothetical protein